MSDLLETKSQGDDSLETKIKMSNYYHQRAIRQLFDFKSKDLFEKNPTLTNFSWTQATDPNCNYEFFDNRFDQSVNGLKYEQIKDEDLARTYRSVAEFLDNFEHDDLFYLFGDHVKVSVTKSGTSLSFFDIEKN